MSFLKRIKDLGESSSHRANMRKEKVATDLAILIAKEGLRRKDIAKRLGISEAALSSRLKGNANLTLDTIGGICDAASVEFDLVFRRRGAQRNLSYWEQAEPSAWADPNQPLSACSDIRKREMLNGDPIDRERASRLTHPLYAHPMDKREGEDAARYRYLRAVGGKSWTDIRLGQRATDEAYDAAVDAARSQTDTSKESKA